MEEKSKQGTLLFLTLQRISGAPGHNEAVMKILQFDDPKFKCSLRVTVAFIRGELLVQEAMS